MTPPLQIKKVPADSVIDSAEAGSEETTAAEVPSRRASKEMDSTDCKVLARYDHLQEIA